ncbi:hypothetical protein KC361_g199 [Hortaea werneckii]|nr:hypothetical protein KC361_g199 [Hortaea werneckii]
MSLRLTHHEIPLLSSADIAYKPTVRSDPRAHQSRYHPRPNISYHPIVVYLLLKRLATVAERCKKASAGAPAGMGGGNAGALPSTSRYEQAHASDHTSRRCCVYG